MPKAQDHGLAMGEAFVAEVGSAYLWRHQGLPRSARKPEGLHLSLGSDAPGFPVSEVRKGAFFWEDHGWARGQLLEGTLEAVKENASNWEPVGPTREI